LEPTLTVFSHLEITRQVDSIRNNVVRPSSEVHIANRFSWQHKTSQHLGEIVCGNSVSITRVKQSALEIKQSTQAHTNDSRAEQAYHWCNNSTHNERDHICPGWEGNVLLDDDDEAKDETTNQNGDVPPPGGFFIVLCHVGMVKIIISAFPCALESLDNILAPKQDAVKQKGSDLPNS
jgi:hypothetical protein